MIDELILGLLVVMFGSFGAVAWSLRGRIEKLPQETAERTTAPLLKAIEKNSAEIARNRDRIDEVRKDLGGQADGFHRDLGGQIDEVRKDLGGQADGFHKDLSGQIDRVRVELSAAVAANRDRIDELRKDLSGQIGYTNRRIDSIYHLLVGGKGELGAEADPASGEAVGASS